MTGLSKRPTSQADNNGWPVAAVLPVDKAVGMTSYDVLRVLKPVFPGVRLGHAGTLDPAASGLLLVCLGPATRLVSWFHTFPKTYIAEILFGVTTDTDDLDGTITVRQPVPADLATRLPSLYQQFAGVIRQTPPSVSAVKTGGRRAYALVRAGETPQLRERSVTIHALRQIEERDQRVVVEITCSSGTYIRSIARDLGQLAGCGACLSSLRRTSLGPFSARDALDISQPPGQWQVGDHLLPLESCLPDGRKIVVDEAESARLKHGVLPYALTPRLPAEMQGPVALVDGSEQLCAIIDGTAGKWEFVAVLTGAAGRSAR